MSYLVPTGRLSEGQRQAVRDVGAMMEVGDEEREDAELTRLENAEEDANFDPASGGESPSTLRILDAYNELREQRGGAAVADDFHLADVDSDEAAIAAQTPDDDAERTRRAIESVGERLNSGVVEYGPGDEVAAVPLDDYTAIDLELAGDFPDDAAPPQQAAPRPAPVEDAGDDGWDGDDRGEYEPRRASEPPVWVAPHER